MREYMQMAQLTVHQDCAKGKDKNMRRTPCDLCGRLFPLVPGGQRAAQPGVAKLSKSTISKVITALLLQAGIDDTGFTSKSMRKGGLSTAKCAGIPAALRKEQSNHVSRAHKVYEYDGETDNDAIPDIPRQKPFSTEDLYRFSRVFGL